MLRLTKEEFDKLIPGRDSNLLKMMGPFTAYWAPVGNFSVVLIENLGLRYVGVSKRNPCDKDSNETGIKIAAIRALKSAVGVDPGYSRQRPVSKHGARVASRVAYLDKIIDNIANNDYSD